jgi:predicted acetyltransferase
MELSVDEMQPYETQLVDRMLQLYLHDMAEWFKFNIMDDGRYGDLLSTHLAANQPVYVARVDGTPAGFALVSTDTDELRNVDDDVNAIDVDSIEVGSVEVDSIDVDMEECFLMRADAPGRWVVRVFTGNEPAVPFWRRAVAEYAHSFSEERRMDFANNEKAEWIWFRFDNRLV